MDLQHSPEWFQAAHRAQELVGVQYLLQHAFWKHQEGDQEMDQNPFNSL
jgi:hypothetical protein